MVEQQKINKKFSGVSSQKSPWYADSMVYGYDPNTFKSQKGFKTIDAMLDDDQVFGVLEMKKAFMLGSGYHFIVEEDAEDKKVQEVLDFIKVNFDEKYDKHFINDLYQVLSALEYGFSMSEMLYKRGDYKGFLDKIWMYRLKTIPPHSVSFYTDDSGELEKVMQHQLRGDVYLPEWKFLHFVKNAKFDNPYGVSELQRCYRAWFIKDVVIKYWGIYLQRFAAPFTIAKVPTDYGDAQTTELLHMLESIQQSGAAVIPNDAEVEFIKVTESSSEYDKAIERFNQMIGRSLLIPDLLGFGQTTGGGSYALGEKQFDTFVTLLQFDRTALEELINEQVIIPLVDLNFGQQSVYPKFKFLPYRDSQLVEMLTLFISSVEKGLPITLEDYNRFRELMNFPQLEKDFKPLETVKKVEEGGDENNDKQPQEEPDIDGEPKEDTPDEQQDGADKGAVKGGDPKALEDNVEKNTRATFAKASRKINKYEKRAGLVEEDTFLRAKEDMAISKISGIFERARHAFKKSIVAKGIIQDKKIGDIKSLKLRFMGEVYDTLLKDLVQIYDTSFINSKKQIKTLKEEQKDALDKFAVKSPNDLFLPSSQAKKLAEAGIQERTFQAVGKLNDDLLNDSKSALLNGIEKGLPTNTVMKNLDDIWNPVVKGTAGAGLSASPALVETIVRTNYTTFYNTAKLQIARSSDLGSPIEMLMYSAILDDRTTEICQSLDGTVLPKNDPMWDRIAPPNHFNQVKEGSLITTQDGDAPIEEIKTGDLVFTHKGNYKRVYETMNKFDDKYYYELSIEGKDNPLYISGEHPILTDTGWKRMDALTMLDSVICIEEVTNG